MHYSFCQYIKFANISQLQSLRLNYLCCARLSNGEGNGTPLQYSCLENPMDRGAWQAAVHGVAKNRVRLSDFTFTFHFRALEKEMATHSSVLAWRIPGTGSLVGCRLWDRTESDTTEATQQQQQQQVVKGIQKTLFSIGFRFQLYILIF